MLKLFSQKTKLKNIRSAGAFIEICPNTGYIRGVYISAMNDQETAVICGTLARISKPRCWDWLKRLIGKNSDWYQSS